MTNSRIRGLQERLKGTPPALDKLADQPQDHLEQLSSLLFESFLLGSFGFNELEGHAIAFPNGEEALPIFLTLDQGRR